MGSDLPLVATAASFVNFNSRSRVGSDAVRVVIGEDDHRVSIRAPAWGATAAQAEVSIRAPAWGATSWFRLWRFGNRVSIRAPV